MNPNIFDYATSELSQDAFICWLLAWAAPVYKDSNKLLNHNATDLLRNFFEKHHKTLPEITTIKIAKQQANIDVLVVLNEEFVIIIEDKTYTQDHSDQLRRYLGEIKSRRFQNERILPVYFKTGDQSSYSEIEKLGYKPFLRSDFLSVLDKGQRSGIESDIYLSYRDYLRGIENRVESYRTLPPYEWHWESWIGFFKALQETTNDSEWGYVSNGSGGFLGFWWHSLGSNDCQQYLQLEEDRLCIKIAVSDEDQQRELRQRWHDLAIEAGDSKNVPFAKPTRFGKGATMTVAVYNGEYRKTDSNGTLDLDATRRVLSAATRALDMASENAQQ